MIEFTMTCDICGCQGHLSDKPSLLCIVALREMIPHGLLARYTSKPMVDDEQEKLRQRISEDISARYKRESGDTLGDSGSGLVG